jgi:hypothetical protein
MKQKRIPIPTTEVLEWLQTHHPDLHAAAEVERAWVWIAADLRGDDKKPIRESIKGYGFIFSRHGGHPLPSGKLGTWGHACTKPLPFKRKPKGQTQTKSQSQQTGAALEVRNSEESLDSLDPELAAFLKS